MSVPKYYTMVNGIKIPSLALGCYDIPRSQTANVVYEALKRGYRHFDTAVLYGNEKEVGEGIYKWLKEDPANNKREDVFYTTKLWNSQNGYSPAKRGISECMNKVKELGYIDLLLIHSPLSGPRRRLETYQAMQEAVDDGIVKSIGVSNYGKQHIEELYKWDKLKHKPVANQIEISPWCMREDLTSWCQSKGLIVEAFSPLTHGYKLKEPGLVSLAKKLGRDTGQVLIRWSLQRGLLPLPKTQNPARLSSNLEVYDFELTPEDVKELDHPEAYEPTDWECTDAP
ncbi:hypothetical protein ZYGR_0AD05000 [Zygosaccharomyces rouxii]|uniref:ZYRO0G17600p n=2 Tax=Zygosaccharomyces rouxii TaxID=4956 RepID=C5E130_ZYGRC|nr:uncharacterized protein ZYRO0G17600g [Zygosaccharomyces rouxii]KAH9202807.1 NADP-dependent oxidoreductase domain-containing protein [Zygosaccharomyces rouxii]GAV51317.1 hypothetical protein ZYGR_0AD05000 [Zygosaccharomyces rouxii]CAR29814.1 ZYRO0G17600p [Zygosaccharomyces rouxii]